MSTLKHRITFWKHYPMLAPSYHWINLIQIAGGAAPKGFRKYCLTEAIKILLSK